ncbi:MAG TPA: HAMP domain-containing sensor histidine kinase [Terriglobia bacterium]|nr:HAMP domain-containing sensor histidine kinase [Terriglobia bacterium]
MKVPGTLRFRMIALFCAVVGVLLVISHVGLGILLSRELRNQLDRQLLSTARPVVADLITDPADEDDVNQLNVPDSYFELIEPVSGRVLQMSQNLAGKALDLRTAALRIAKPAFYVVSNPHDEAPEARLRLALIPFQRANRSMILAVAAPNRVGREVLEQFAWIVAAFLLLSLLLTAWLSTWYVSRSLAPITAFTAHARKLTERISQRDGRELWTPLPIEHPNDELGQLAATFNELFAQVYSALGQLRQFVTDASHELRTPLSVLRGETELLLAEPRSPADYQKALQIIDGELGKLTRIVEGLFTISMADAGQLRLLKEPLYLNEVLEEACGLAAPRARQKSITILGDLKQELPYQGDEAFLRQLFLILLDNAIKYSPPETTVRVGLEKSNGLVKVEFEDQGIGISQSELPRIFERFYRASSQPTSGESQSGGLGLAIAQAIVQAQGGLIDCRSAPGCGSTFTVSLPFVRDTSHGAKD